MRLPARLHRPLALVPMLGTLVVTMMFSPAHAQVNIPSFGTPLSQNFNTLAPSGTSAVLPGGWHLLEIGTGANNLYSASDGSSSTGDTYSFGSTGSMDRAFGGIRAVAIPMSFDPTIGAEFVNNTGGTIGSLDIGYTGEQWRLGAVGRTDQLVFEYSTDATNLNTGTWIQADNLVFTAPTTTGTVGALSGNASANRTVMAGSICGLSIANGATFWIRWTDFDATGADDGLGVDDFSLTARSIPSISIGNVTHAEGNAGNTAFQFPLTLSAVSACDVSVHYGTADGSAKTADGDYLFTNGTATIPAGSTAGTITVQVKSDVTHEGSETFTVNLSAPVGGTLLDAQGLGTITNDDPVPTISIGGVTVAEGNSGTTPFAFALALSNPSDVDVTVQYATADGTATVADNDYVAASGTATVTAGSTSGTISVLVNGDATPEADENFSVTLSSPMSATLGAATGTGLITNDDLTTLTTTPDANGTITRNPNQATYAYGTVVTLTAVPSTGYYLVAWGGDASGSANPLNVTMDANKTITATFGYTYRSYGPLTIKQIQDPNTLPNPVGIPNPSGSAVGDTIGPVCGIVTGFDTFPAEFGFYLQNSQGGPWTGIEVFTGPNNTIVSLGLQMGDSVCVEGALSEISTVTAPCPGAGVDGDTEINAKNGLFGTDLIITKIDSGHPLPPYHVGGVNELQEPCTNTNAEQWEGCLVRVNGPMRIARTNVTGGLGSSSAALVVDNSVCPPGDPGACDSMFIDLSTLPNPTISPGNAGQILDYVQGIYSERSRGYRIEARNIDDYGLGPPTLVRVFDIGNNVYRVILDRAVTQATAEDENNYFIQSITSHRPDLATQVTGTTVDLTVTVPLNPGDEELVTVGGLAALSSGTTMTSSESSTFHFGILSPAQIQGPDTDSLAASPCRDVARFQSGGLVTVRGVCTAKLSANLYYLQGSTNPRDGIEVYAPPVELVRGRRYVVVGNPQEFFDETELVTVAYANDEGSDAVPTPINQTIAVLKNATCDAGQSLTTGEDYEGMLVGLAGVQCTEDASPGQDFFVTTVPASPDTILITHGSPSQIMVKRNELLNVDGILHFNFDTFRIVARDDDDIDSLRILAVENSTPDRVSFSVFPNPGRTSRVRFGLPHADRVELAVYDIAGRQLAVLARGPFTAGAFTRDWDGRDRAGQPVRSGTYFIRLRLAGDTRILRTVMIK